MAAIPVSGSIRSEEHTSELQSLTNLVCRLLLEKKIDAMDHRHEALDFRAPADARLTEGRVVDAGVGLNVTVRVVHRREVWQYLVLFFLNARRTPKSSPFPHPAALQI